jgi:hypothetical protein
MGFAQWNHSQNGNQRKGRRGRRTQITWPWKLLQWRASEMNNNIQVNHTVVANVDIVFVVQLDMGMASKYEKCKEGAEKAYGMKNEDKHYIDEHCIITCD